MVDPNPISATTSRVPSSAPASGSSPLADQVRSLRLPPSAASGSRTAGLAWGLCLLLAGAAGWLGWQWQTSLKQLATAKAALETQPLNGSGDSKAEKKPTITTTKASATEIALESKGYIIAAHQILVSPQVSGRLLKLSVEEGRRVKKGELLGEIESTEYRADVARGKASLELAKQHLLELENGNRPEEIEQSKAELAESEAQLKQLEAEWQRNARLVKNNVITEQDFEVIESRFHAMQRRVDRLTYATKIMTLGPRNERIQIAKAEVEQAEAELAKATWRLGNCTIVAPISGTILKKNAEEGNIVNPVAFNGSFSVCDMADLADLEVSLDIQERDIRHVFVGQKCRVRAEAFADRSYEGTVSRLMPIADRAKGAIPVRVKLSVPADEEGVYLKPEMGAVVTFLNREES